MSIEHIKQELVHLKPEQAERVLLYMREFPEDTLGAYLLCRRFNLHNLEVRYESERLEQTSNTGIEE